MREENGDCLAVVVVVVVRALLMEKEGIYNWPESPSLRIFRLRVLVPK